jgi:hypothetical protein
MKTTPIPLTEEWLRKLGFEIVIEYPDNYKRWSNGIIGFDKAPGEQPCFGINFDSKDALNKYKSEQLKYVHQFQNLYFALTGEELVMK